MQFILCLFLPPTLGCYKGLNTSKPALCANSSSSRRVLATSMPSPPTPNGKELVMYDSAVLNAFSAMYSRMQVSNQIYYQKIYVCKNEKHHLKRDAKRASSC